MMPIAELESLEIIWNTIAGSPPSPYFGALISLGGTDEGTGAAVIMCRQDSASLTSSSIGGYDIPELSEGMIASSYWNSSMAVSIPISDGETTQYGVRPCVSDGPCWYENSYLWSEFVMANPSAVFTDATISHTTDPPSPHVTRIPGALVLCDDQPSSIKLNDSIIMVLINGDEVRLGM